eukprot:Gb_02384 [translate_table: standard]
MAITWSRPPERCHDFDLLSISTSSICICLSISVSGSLIVCPWTLKLSEAKNGTKNTSACSGSFTLTAALSPSPPVH